MSKEIKDVNKTTVTITDEAVCTLADLLIALAEKDLEKEHTKRPMRDKETQRRDSGCKVPIEGYDENQARNHGSELRNKMSPR